MKPIAYDTIAKKAEARRVAVEKFVESLNRHPALWDEYQNVARKIGLIYTEYSNLDDEARSIIACALGIGTEQLGNAMSACFSMELAYDSFLFMSRVIALNQAIQSEDDSE